MAAAVTTPFVSVEEYLHSVYEPDMDYVDGELEDRNVGEIEHSDLQGELVVLLRTSGKAWGIRAFPEQRVQVSAKKFRVPDICVMPRAWEKTPIILQPPLLCIEIVSPEDTFSRVQRKCRDYIEMGVPEVWIFDPFERVVHIQSATGQIIVQRMGILQLQDSPIQIDIQAAFSVLDED